MCICSNLRVFRNSYNSNTNLKGFSLRLTTQTTLTTLSLTVTYPHDANLIRNYGTETCHIKHLPPVFIVFACIYIPLSEGKILGSLFCNFAQYG